MQHWDVQAILSHNRITSYNVCYTKLLRISVTIMIVVYILWVIAYNRITSYNVCYTKLLRVDYFWKNLSAVPESEQCGWLKDKYGLAWQIVPRRLTELIGDPDSQRAKRAMQAMMQMVKIDVAAVEAAASA